MFFNSDMQDMVAPKPRQRQCSRPPHAVPIAGVVLGEQLNA